MNCEMAEQDRLCIMAAILAARSLDPNGCGWIGDGPKTGDRLMAEWAVAAAREIIKVTEEAHA